MSEAPASYPLVWPAGFPRSKTKRVSAFRKDGGFITLEAARGRLAAELDRLRAKYVVLSSNVPMRLDGKPGTDWRGVQDVGVCCYFQLSGRPISLPCDQYLTVPGNIAAIAAHIHATRAIERHGVGSLEKLFAGFVALPSPDAPAAPWWKVLGFDDLPNDFEYVQYRYRKLIAEAHPDKGGSHDQAAALTAAMSEARKALA